MASKVAKRKSCPPHALASVPFRDGRWTNSRLLFLPTIILPLLIFLPVLSITIALSIETKFRNDVLRNINLTLGLHQSHFTLDSFTVSKFAFAAIVDAASDLFISDPSSSKEVEHLPLPNITISIYTMPSSYHTQLKWCADTWINDLPENSLMVKSTPSSEVLPTNIDQKYLVEAPPHCHDYWSLACKDAHGLLRFLDTDGPYAHSDWMVVGNDDNYFHVDNLRKLIRHLTPLHQSGRTHALAYGHYACVQNNTACPQPNGGAFRTFVTGFCGGGSFIVSRFLIERLVLTVSNISSLAQLDAAAKQRFLDIYGRQNHGAETPIHSDLLMTCFMEDWLGNININNGMGEFVTLAKSGFQFSRYFTDGAKTEFGMFGWDNGAGWEGTDRLLNYCGTGVAGATVFHYLQTEQQFRTVRQLWEDLNCTDYRRGLNLN